jgi:threonine dehydratase
LEIARDVPQTTIIVVPIGGGGLISGVAIAAKSILPEVRIVGVQSEMVAPVKGSLAAGKPVAVEVGQTIADGIAVKHPGAITLPLIREFVDEVVEVSEEEIAQAIFSPCKTIGSSSKGAGAAGFGGAARRKSRFEKGRRGLRGFVRRQH